MWLYLILIMDPHWGSGFFNAKVGLEEGGLAVRQGNKVSGGHLISPGESP